MDSLYETIQDILDKLPTLIGLGVSTVGMLAWVREVLDANAAPDDPTWQRLDKFVSDNQAAFRAAAADQPGG